MKLTIDQVNYLNIGLMLASLVMAFLLPFELFLFSYAILGPAHYLTEISWLHDRKYFAPKKWDFLPLVILSLLILLGSQSMVGEGVFEAMNAIPIGKDGLGNLLADYSWDLTFLAFGVAFIFILLPKRIYRIYSLIVLVFAMYIFHGNNFYFSIFAIYMPTMIHVYLFTGAFIIFGALKGDSRSGYLSFAVFIGCAIACFAIPHFTGYSASQWAQESYNDGFRYLSYNMLDHFMGYDRDSLSAVNVFTDSGSIILARFIAFAYTYHYLNWFSKTSVIKWHNIPKARFVGVVILWIASVALYLKSYQLGFRWLFLLSFAHVLLEFPLNHQSFIGIGKELRSRIKPAGAKT